ncbi:MAG: transporter substrate-binding domain-containing protein [Pseudomonadota bacterium]
MRSTAFWGALGVVAFMGVSASAQTIACGGTYTVQRGDNLQKITRGAYGPALSWSYLYGKNKGVIGANPSIIEVGMTLNIPCRKGQTPAAQTTAAASTATTEESSSASSATATAETETETTTAATSTTAAAPAAAPAERDRSPMLRLVTASDYAPFHDESLEGGGMITEIVDVALTTVMDESDYRIDFINDWGAHLNPLISDMSYDVSLSWFKPNCDVIEKLGAGSRFRCERLEFSDPLFEQIVSYFMRADDAAKPESHADLFGRAVCRPAGYSTFMMEEVDLVEPNITFVQPSGPSDCMEMLANGSVDAVVIASTVADDTIAQLGIADQVEEQPQLATIITLHAVTSIDNPSKDQIMATMNDGIRNVRESGKWFEIVQRHLIAHTRKTATN